METDVPVGFEVLELVQHSHQLVIPDHLYAIETHLGVSFRSHPDCALLVLVVLDLDHHLQVAQCPCLSPDLEEVSSHENPETVPGFRDDGEVSLSYGSADSLDLLGQHQGFLAIQVDFQGVEVVGVSVAEENDGLGEHFEVDVGLEHVVIAVELLVDETGAVVELTP